MINKKLSRILGPSIGVMGLILVMGIINISPVYAEETVQATSKDISSATTSASVKDIDYSVNINKSVSQNGIKVTVEKAMSTKHKLKAVVKVESEQPLNNMERNNSIYMLTYGEGQGRSHTDSSQDYVDDKTIILTLENDNYEGEYPEKGDLRVDIVLSNYKVNIGIDTTVDFTNSFNNILQKNILGKIPLVNYSLNELETDEMGTRIIYTEPEDDKNNQGDNNALIEPIILLKVGDNLYKTNNNGSYTKNDVETGNYESTSAIYEKVKDEKNISIIPVTCNMSWKDLSKQYDNIKDKAEVKRETTSNVNYEKNFDFSDGSKGEIYNIERTDNSVKVYCKGKSEIEGLLMACNLRMNYQYEEGKNNWKVYDSDRGFLCKDPKDALGYIVEFDNVDKSKPVDLYIDNVIRNIDKYKIQDEIKLSN